MSQVIVVMSSLLRSIRKPSVEIVRHRRTMSRRPNKWISKHTHEPNPGIQNQLEILEPEKGMEIEPSDFDEAEMDFMEVDKMHHLHESEEEKLKHVQQIKIVGNKYFKREREPNMLTWAEKEQIRYLHNSDEDKWTIEKLSQSFPASETTIKKILKASWRPYDANRILKHDQVVKNNWDLFTNGKLDVDPELKDHFSQFTQRTVSPFHMPETDGLFSDETSRPKVKSSEFGSIIQSYESLKSKEKSSECSEKNSKAPDMLYDKSSAPKGDSFLIHGGKSYSPYGRVTLDKYREKILKAIERGHEASADDKMVIKNIISEDKSKVENTHHLHTSPGHIDLTENKGVRNHTDFTAETYPPDRIQIPKNKWKRGGTFKLSDCYYDDDGRFLYRVPGMK